MVNSVVLVGRLGQDPKLSVTSGGISLCKFSVAVQRNYRTPSGDRETDWIDVVAWRERAEYCANYLKKGSMVAVQGRIQVRKWETPEGEPRRTYEVVAENVQNLSPSGRGVEDPGYQESDIPPETDGGRPSNRGSSGREPFGDDADDVFSPDDDPFGSE